MSSSSSLLWKWQNQVKMNLLLDTTTNPYVSWNCLVGLRVDRKIMRKQCSDVFGCHARVLTKFIHSFKYSYTKSSTHIFEFWHL